MRILRLSVVVCNAFCNAFEATRGRRTLRGAAHRVRAEHREGFEPQGPDRPPSPRGLRRQLPSLSRFSTVIVTTPAAQERVELSLRGCERAEAHEARPRAKPRAVEAGVRAKRRAAVRQRRPGLLPTLNNRLFFIILRASHVPGRHEPVNKTRLILIARTKIYKMNPPGRRPVRVAHRRVPPAHDRPGCRVHVAPARQTHGFDRAGVTGHGGGVATRSKMFVALLSDWVSDRFSDWVVIGYL